MFSAFLGIIEANLRFLLPFNVLLFAVWGKILYHMQIQLDDRFVRGYINDYRIDARTMRKWEACRYFVSWILHMCHVDSWFKFSKTLLYTTDTLHHFLTLEKAYTVITIYFVHCFFVVVLYHLYHLRVSVGN